MTGPEDVLPWYRKVRWLHATMLIIIPGLGLLSIPWVPCRRVLIGKGSRLYFVSAKGDTALTAIIEGPDSAYQRDNITAYNIERLLQVN